MSDQCQCASKVISPFSQAPGWLRLLYLQNFSTIHIRLHISCASTFFWVWKCGQPREQATTFWGHGPMASPAQMPLLSERMRLTEGNVCSHKCQILSFWVIIYLLPPRQWSGRSKSVSWAVDLENSYKSVNNFPELYSGGFSHKSKGAMPLRFFLV